MLGLILAPLGFHMSLTWPLATGGFAFDDIIFGEPSLAFGVLMLALSLLLCRRGDRIVASPHPIAELARTARTLSVLIVGLGLALIGIMFAGMVYQLFAAPPQEPISGAFAAWPVLEATFMSLLFGLTGLGAVLFPLALRSVAALPGEGPRTVPGMAKTVGILWTVTGVIFVLFGAMNFYTHIGLVVNTM